MKVMVRLMGGLGNQMFQYAFGLSMSLRHHAELVLDDTLLRDRSVPHEIASHRTFELGVFPNVRFRWADKSEVAAFNGDPQQSVFDRVLRKLMFVLRFRRLVIQVGNAFRPEYLKLKSDTCFVGRWQSYLYVDDFRDQVRNAFFIPVMNPGLNEIAHEIESTTSVAIHVRRGDLVTSPLYSSQIGAQGPDYYQKAIQRFESEVTNVCFFVFSDDVDWCKGNLKFLSPVSYVSGSNSAIEDLYLMTKARHFIISNSTFSWWGAWLSPYEEKRVIYPARWFNDASLNNEKMCPEQWTAL